MRDSNVAINLQCQYSAQCIKAIQGTLRGFRNIFYFKEKISLSYKFVNVLLYNICIYKTVYNSNVTRHATFDPQPAINPHIFWSMCIMDCHDMRQFSDLLTVKGG